MPLQLIGLPGAGKSKLQSALAEQDVEQDFCITVIDVRSPMNNDRLAEDHLKACVAASHAVVFQFMEAADLNQQSFWQNWCKQQLESVLILRSMHNQLPANWQQKIGQFQQKNAQKHPLPPAPELPLESFRFEVPKLVLEHLMMGLDASRNNLNQSILRVQGVLDTLEYQNPVQIEGTFNRLDSYAGDGLATGWLEIQGVRLDENWLKQLVEASYA